MQCINRIIINTIYFCILMNNYISRKYATIDSFIRLSHNHLSFGRKNCSNFSFNRQGYIRNCVRK